MPPIATVLLYNNATKQSDADARGSMRSVEAGGIFMASASVIVHVNDMFAMGALKISQV